MTATCIGVSLQGVGVGDRLLSAARAHRSPGDHRRTTDSMPLVASSGRLGCACTQPANVSAKRLLC